MKVANRNFEVEFALELLSECLDYGNSPEGIVAEQRWVAELPKMNSKELRKVIDNLVALVEIKQGNYFAQEIIDYAKEHGAEATKFKFGIGG